MTRIKNKTAMLLAAAACALTEKGADAGPVLTTPPSAIAEPAPWSLPDGTKLRLVILCDAKAAGDRVAARIEQAPSELELPRNSVIEGHVVFMEDAGSLRAGSLTVLFERITTGGRSPQALAPFAARFECGRGRSRLNRLVLVGGPLLAAVLGAVAAGGDGVLAATPPTLGLAWVGVRSNDPRLKTGEYRTVAVRRVDLGIETAAMRRTGRQLLSTLPDLPARAESEPAACALYLELREQDPWLLARVAEHYAQWGEARVAREVLDEALAMYHRPATLRRKYGDDADNLKAYALASIAIAEARLGNPSKARELADSIDTDFRHRMGGLAKDSALAAIATQLARSGNFDAALKLANDRWGCRWIRAAGDREECVSDEDSRRRTLVDIAILLAGAGKADRALKTIATIEDADEKGRALEAVSQSLLARGQAARARLVLTGARSQAEAEPALLVRLAAAYRRVGASEEGQALLDKAVHLTDPNADDHGAAAIRMQVAKECFAYGRQEQAAAMLNHTFKIVKTAKYEMVRQQLALLRDMTAISAHAGCFDHAKELARAIEDEDYGDEALTEIVKAYVGAGQLAQASDLAGSIRDPDHHVTALCALASGLAAAGNKADATATLTRALAAVPESRNPALHLIAIDAQYRAGQLAPNPAAKATLRKIVAGAP
jgi:tetratricopeptide (TPR) repeat protein